MQPVKPSSSLYHCCTTWLHVAQEEMSEEAVGSSHLGEPGHQCRLLILKLHYSQSKGTRALANVMMRENQNCSTLMCFVWNVIRYMRYLNICFKRKFGYCCSRRCSQREKRSHYQQVSQVKRPCTAKDKRQKVLQSFFLFSFLRQVAHASSMKNITLSKSRMRNVASKQSFSQLAQDPFVHHNGFHAPTFVLCKAGISLQLFFCSAVILHATVALPCLHNPAPRVV